VKLHKNSIVPYRHTGLENVAISSVVGQPVTPEQLHLLRMHADELKCERAQTCCRRSAAKTDPASASPRRLIATFAMSCAAGVQEVCRENEGPLKRKAVEKCAVPVLPLPDRIP